MATRLGFGKVKGGSRLDKKSDTRKKSMGKKVKAFVLKNLNKL